MASSPPTRFALLATSTRTRLLVRLPTLQVFEKTLFRDQLLESSQRGLDASLVHIDGQGLCAPVVPIVPIVSSTVITCVVWGRSCARMKRARIPIVLDSVLTRAIVDTLVVHFSRH